MEEKERVLKAVDRKKGRYVSSIGRGSGLEKGAKYLRKELHENLRKDTKRYNDDE